MHLNIYIGEVHVTIRQQYMEASQLTGPLQEGHRTVTYRQVLSQNERRKLVVWMGGTLAIGAFLIYWTLTSPVTSTIGWAAVILIISIETIRIALTTTLWSFASKAVDPVPIKPASGWRVAVHTTIVPGKEPFDIVARTLLAMKKMVYDGGTVDVWLLDEGNDPTIKDWCAQHGVHHFSRKGRPDWNTDTGQFKARTKHGNLNSFHDMHGHRYDIVAQMDPDHVPSTNFLERTLGYFQDPDVGFVVAPQVYGNGADSWIAKASAFQAYVFHGVIQRGGNGRRAPLLIGTNHLVRVTALRDVGGYADNIIEDHLTSMAMFAKKNDRNNYWKGVYTPDILSIGEGPTSFTDYFNQQKRWAYGIWEIAQKHSPRMFGGMKLTQRIAFTGLQFFYPSMAISWILSFLLSALIVTGSVSLDLTLVFVAAWAASLSMSLGFFWWLRKFNLVEHERRDWGFAGMALLLMCIPVYVSAGIQALMRRKLTYAVTAKGDLASPDTLKTFASHQVWIGLIMGLTGFALYFSDSAPPVALFWLSWMILVCASPIALHLKAAARSRRLEAAPEYVPLRSLVS